MGIYAFGPFQLNAERLALTSAGEAVPLGRRVVETLLALVERRGDVVSKEALLDRVWPAGFVEESNLTQNIYVLRRIFRAYGAADPIETVPRVGYRFTAPIREIAAAPRSRWRPVVARAALLAASLVLVAGGGPESRGSSPSGRLSNDGARLYQIGNYYWSLRTPDGVRKSLAYFTRVVDADPRAPQGYGGLAEANVSLGDYCYGTHRPGVYFARARAYAAKALQLDPDAAPAHAVLGFLAMQAKNKELAMRELTRAIVLDPSYSPAHEWYGIALVDGGHSPEGLRQLHIAADLDPLSVTATAWLASTAYANGHFAGAVVYAQQALELSPQRADALVTLGEAYVAQRDYVHATESFKRYGALSPYYRPQAAALLARAYALERRTHEARAQFAYALALREEIDPALLSAAADALGESGKTSLARRRGHDAWTATENAARIGSLRKDV